jgi:hypothetical protein
LVFEKMQVGFFLKPPVGILLAWGGGIHIENGLIMGQWQNLEGLVGGAAL